MRKLFLLLIVSMAMQWGFAQGYGNFPYAQTFTSGSQPAEITVPTNSNTVSFSTNGMFLTPLQTNYFGAVYFNNVKFNSQQGIKIEFEYGMYGSGTLATGADGLCVFLFDASETNPQVGADGEGLAYTYQRATNTYAVKRRKGLSGAYLGIGLDAWGAFHQRTYTTNVGDRFKSGLYPALTNNKSQVTLRGAAGKTDLDQYGRQAGYNGYPLLITKSTLSGAGAGAVLNDATGAFTTTTGTTDNFYLNTLAWGNTSADANYRKAFIELLPNPSGGYNVTVKIQHGSTITTVINNYWYKTSVTYVENANNANAYTGLTGTDDITDYIPTSASNAGDNTTHTLNTTAPQYFRIGFGASTGSNQNNHVIRNLRVTIPYSAVATDDNFTLDCSSNSNTVNVLTNDFAYNGITGTPTSSVANIDKTSFRFIDASGTAQGYTYTESGKGTWSYNTTTGIVTFTRVAGYSGTVQIRYDIKGSASPLNDEAYRSTMATITATVNAQPTITVSPNVSICNGASTVLTASGATSYSWSPSTGLSATTGSSVTANPTSTTVYTVTGTTTGCSNTATVTVTVTTPATPLIGTVTQPTCGVATGSFTITNYNAALTYAVSPSTGVTRSGATITAPAGTYTVTASNGTCTSASSANVVVNAQPATPATPVLGTVTQPTCGVATGSFTITNYNAALTYTVSPSTGVTQSGATITAPAGTYTVTASNGTCTSALSANVVVNAQPATPAIPTLGTVTQPTCTVATGSFTIANYDAALTYTVSPSAGVSQSGAIFTAPAGTYTVTAKNASGCTSVASLPVTLYSVLSGIDSDGDGIDDACDLDDDNDGILDTDECPTIHNTPVYHLYDLDSSDPNNTLWLYKQTNGIGSDFVCPDKNCQTEIGIWYKNTNILGSVTCLAYDDGKYYTIDDSGNLLFTDDIVNKTFTSLGSAREGSGFKNLGYDNGVFYHWKYDGSSVLTLYKSTDPVNSGWTSMGTIVNRPYSYTSGSYTYELKDIAVNDNVFYFYYYNSDNSITSTNNGLRTNVFSTTSPTSSTAVWADLGSTNFGSNVYNIAIGSEDIKTVCDTDGDGIPNQLDLDSDGDGCPDAIEGAGNFNPTTKASGTLSTQNPNINFGVDVDANGVPTAVGAAGQGVGTSQQSGVKDALCSTSPICNNGTIFSLSTTGEIRSFTDPASSGTLGILINSTSYGSTTNANALGYSSVTGKFYYFQVCEGSEATKVFVSYDPATNTYATLSTTGTGGSNIYRGAVTNDGKGYYALSSGSKLFYYDIANNTWTTIVADNTHYIDQYGNSLQTTLSKFTGGDLAIDGDGNMWVLAGTTGSKVCYVFKLQGPLPTTAVTGSLTLTQIATQSIGVSPNGIGFDSTGQLFITNGSTTGNNGNLFRINNDYTITEVGELSTPTGDLVSCAFPINPLSAMDFGDAPDTYKTLQASNGASHLPAQFNAIDHTSPLMLGSKVDIEIAGHPSINADGDDVNGIADEDGVAVFPLLTTTSTSYSLPVSVTNTTGTSATVKGWIDFNRDGVFDASEGAIATVASGATTATLTWTGLSGLTLGAKLYSRIRIATNATEIANPTGVASDGEVEDYRQIEIVLPPFACNNSIYLSIGTATASDPVTLYSINYDVNPFTVTAIGDNSHGVAYNGIAYNKSDNYIYAVSRSGNHLYRIGNNGAVQDLGVVSGLPSDSYVSGEILPDGRYIVRANSTTKNLYIIDINSVSATSLVFASGVNIADIAYSSKTGMLYAVAQNPIPEKLLAINPNTGVYTQVGSTGVGGAFGAMFSTSDGDVYGVSNGGDLCQFNLSTGVATKIQSVTTATTQLDGTACISPPLFKVDLGVTKTDNQVTYTPGSTVTYQIVVTNKGPANVIDALVTDLMPAGIPSTNINYTASVTNGATTSVTGTQTGAISDKVYVPVGGTIEYTVNVNVPSSYTGDLKNTVKVEAPANFTDVDLTNNEAADIDTYSCTPPAVPTISTTPASCSAAGTATISTYSSTNTYTFTPTGPSVGTGGVITGMTAGTSYTVVASNGSCTSVPSSPFSIDAMLSTPAAPTVSTTPASCSAAGTATISTYSSTNTYTFNPTGPIVGTGGVITGMTAGTSYTVAANNGSCTSVPSSSFRIDAMLSTPAAPTVSITPASCGAAGTATISTYSSTNTYTFTPTGPSVGTGGVITGMTAGTSYTVAANNGSCTSVPSSPFRIDAMLSAPSLSLASASPTICSGATATLTASGANLGTVKWSSDYYTISGAGTSITSGVLTNKGTASLDVHITAVADNGGCTATATATVTVLPEPRVLVAPGSIEVCASETPHVTLTPVLAGTAIHWELVDNAGKRVNSGDSTGSINLNGFGVPLSSGDYTLKVTGTTITDGCTSSEITVPVKVH